MIYRSYDDITYALKAAITVGRRGVVATNDASRPTQLAPDRRATIHELVETGAEKRAKVEALLEARVAEHRETASRRHADGYADEQLLAEANEHLDDEDHAARDDRFTWSPGRALAGVAAVLATGAAASFATPEQAATVSLVLSIAFTLAAILALLAGRAFGKAPEGHPHQKVAAVVAIALLTGGIAAFFGREKPFAVVVGLAVVCGSFLLGWLAGRHDRVRPRQQRHDRIAALRANVADHRGVGRQTQGHIADERRHAAAAIRSIQALTIGACARACGEVTDLNEAEALLTEAESLVGAWTLSPEEPA